MGKSGGQGKGKPGLHDKHFGKALLRKHAQGRQGQEGTRNTGKEKVPIMSFLETSALEDYVAEAEMEGRQAEVHRVHQNDAFLVDSKSKRTVQELTLAGFEYSHLRIPRKPAWNVSMTAEEVDRHEKDAFLAWRRDVAALEQRNQGKKVTPFEKNIEVWRQLWRVLERSDLVIQIVDARNPLLYYTNDLVTYAGELSPPKKMLIIVNKSDLLSDYQRAEWSREFELLHIKALFYSAHAEQEKIDRAAAHPDEPSVVAEEDEPIDEEELLLIVEDLEQQFQAVYQSQPLSSQSKTHQSVARGVQQSTIKELDEEEDEEEDDASGEADLETETEGSASAAAEDDDERSSQADEHEDSSVEGDDDDEDEEAAASSEENSAEADVNEAEEEVNEEEDLEVVWGDGVATTLQSAAPPKQAPTASLLRDADASLRSRVLNRKQLIFILGAISARLQIAPQPRHKGHVCVGLIGYPNVGKSSVINTILEVSKSSHGSVRVGVSSTPGKTKHFQTLIVSETLMLCDCPGLVFPSFMSSKGEMLCSGILPINNMRDYIEPAQVIASRVPMHLLEAAYGMRIKRELDVSDSPDRPPTAFEMLCAYCAVKGYITNGTGRWDEFRACKDMLKDFTDGNILYVAPPNAAVDMDRWLQDTEAIMARREKVAKRVAVARLKKAQEELLEEQEAAAAAAAEEGGMVFGEGRFADVGSEDGEDDEAPQQREHKRLKQWGKKNKKLRNKTPYGEDSPVSFVAYSTNRSITTNLVRASDTAQRLSEDRVKRRDPNKEYGTPFVGVKSLVPQKL